MLTLSKYSFGAQSGSVGWGGGGGGGGSESDGEQPVETLVFFSCVCLRISLGLNADMAGCFGEATLFALGVGEVSGAGGPLLGSK